MNKDALRKEWERLHEEACARGEDHYPDPKTGFLVFTRLHHLKRKACCRSGCRHCPYGYTRKKA